jgi:hypothetical protein
MDTPYPIDQIKIENNDRIPKSVDHPSKPCGEQLSGDYYKK